jgi:hypothetical protein
MAQRPATPRVVRPARQPADDFLQRQGGIY